MEVLDILVKVQNLDIFRDQGSKGRENEPYTADNVDVWGGGLEADKTGGLLIMGRLNRCLILKVTVLPDLSLGSMESTGEAVDGLSGLVATWWDNMPWLDYKLEGR